MSQPGEDPPVRQPSSLGWIALLVAVILLFWGYILPPHVAFVTLNIEGSPSGIGEAALAPPSASGILTASGTAVASQTSTPIATARTSALATVSPTPIASTSASGSTAAVAHTRVAVGSLAACPAAFQAVLREYAAWHGETLASMRAAAAVLPPGQTLPRPVPVVVYVCLPNDECGGLGDRLTGVTLLFYYALRMKALFFIDMPALRLGAVPATFDWRLDNVSATLASFVDDADRPGVVSDRNCIDDCTFFGKPFDYTPAVLGTTMLRAMTNRGLFFTKNHAQHQAGVAAVGLSAATWGCVYRALLSPSAIMAASIAGDVAAMAAARVAVCTHLRVGDDVMRMQSGETEAAPSEEAAAPLSCVREAVALLNATAESAVAVGRHWAGLLPGNGTLPASHFMVLLASDSAYVKAHARELLRLPAGIPVRSVAVQAVHIDSVSTREHTSADAAERMYATLLEWFTMGACTLWAGSLSSGYSRTAAAYSLSQHVLTSMAAFKEAGAGASGGECGGLFPVSRFFSYIGSSGA